MHFTHSVEMTDTVHFKKSDGAYYEDRLKTFQYWPKQLKQTKESLARAGFYYTGIGDKVTCFACRLTIVDWETTDKPFIEHQKWTTNCPYLNIVGYSSDHTAQEETDQKQPNKYGFGSNYFVNPVPKHLFGKT